MGAKILFKIEKGNWSKTIIQSKEEHKRRREIQNEIAS